MEEYNFQHLSTTTRNNIHLYGRLLNGKSICVEVVDIKPYVYVEQTIVWYNKYLKEILQCMKYLMAHDKMKQLEKYSKDVKTGIHRFLQKFDSQITCEITKGFNIRHVMETEPNEFLKITMKSEYLKAFVKCVKDPEKAFQEILRFYQLYKLSPPPSLKRLENETIMEYQTRCSQEYTLGMITQPSWTKQNVFESHIPLDIVYMIDTNLPCCGWITVKGFQKHLKNKCNIQLQAVSICKTENPPPMAPLRVLSYDIEAQPYVLGHECLFPQPERDPILCIGVCTFDMLTQTIKQYNFVYEPQPSKEYPKTDTDDYNAADTKIFSFKDEYDMLLAFNHFINKEDPDIITGYNILNFDNVYTIKRAKHLFKDGEKAWCWGRNNRECYLKSQYKFSNQKGGKETWECRMEGREFLDLYKIIMDDHKLRSYKLDEVAAHFLGTRKIHISYDDIPKMQQTVEGRIKLGMYCVKDAWIPCKLAIKMAKVLNAVLMSRVTGVSLNTILNRGQQIRTIALMLKKCKEREQKGDVRWFLPDEDDAPDTGSFEGAVVITPKPGFYDQPVATLDFASLYPSIMRAYNMCFSTLIATPKEAQERGYTCPQGYRPVRTFTYPDGGKFQYLDKPDDICFITAEKRQGILPEILDQLLTQRKKTKKQMKQHDEHSMEYAVCNGRQLALKVCANSVYGFTGASKGFLPDKRIASSVTRAGRGMANESKFMCEDKYKEYGVKVVYGDTDSIFVHLPKKICSGKTREEIIQRANTLAEEMANMCNKAFLPPNDLEFEKVYYPLLLKGKKRYAGYKFEPGLQPKLDVKGFECVRRDFAPIVSKTQKKIFTLLCQENNVNAAVQFARQTVVNLLEGKVPIEDLTMSKQLTRPPDQYKNPAPHVELAKRLQRTLPPTQAPKTGDRIDYVIKTGREKMFLRSVQPQEIGKYAIDTKWYLENQLKEPLKRVFDMIMDNSKDIFKISTIKKSNVSKHAAFSSFVVKNSTKRTHTNEIIEIKRKKQKVVDIKSFFICKE